MRAANQAVHEGCPNLIATNGVAPHLRDMRVEALETNRKFPDEDR